MAAKMRKLLVPQYAKQFQCIGPECEDSCCAGWQVYIDKGTYKRYRSCPDNELRRQLDAKVTRQRTNPSNDIYAKIKLNEDATCPFLDVDKLCAIQRSLGETYLSCVCTTYPRTANNVNGVIEESLVMSCPEALRLALLNPELMEFDEIEEDVILRKNISIVLDTDKSKDIMSFGRYFWDLRIFIISLLQNRSYLLWQRLVILGLFCRKLDQLLYEAKAQEIPALIGTYSDYLDNGSFQQEMANLTDAVTVQMQLMKEVADARLQLGVISGRFMECFGEFMGGIDYNAESSTEEIAQRYAEAFSQYYQPFMESREYILENYVVNYVFKNMFPLGEGKHVFDSYTMLVVHYAMIKLFLIGMAGFHKENFGEEHVVKLIQSFSRAVEHDMSYLKKVFSLLKAEGYNTMPYMSILIKN